MFNENEIVGYKRFGTSSDIEYAKVISVDESTIGLKVLKSEAYKSRSEDVMVDIKANVHERVFRIAPTLIDSKKAELEQEILKDATQTKKLFKELKFMFTKEEKAEMKVEIADVIDAKIQKLNDDKSSIVSEE